MASQISSSNHGYIHVPSTSSGRELTTSDKFSENPKPYSTGLRALVVDSNPASRKFISSMLSDNMYEVVAAESATEALTFIFQRKNELDLVLTEFILPDMEGIEFLQRIKRESKLPVVFLSSEKREEVKILCLSKGASVYLEKPILARDVKNLWQFTVFNRYNNDSDNNNKKKKKNDTIDATAVAPVEKVNKGKSVQKNKGGSSSEMVGDNFRYPVSMRPKMTWTEELHHKFVDAVNTLGFHFARPRMILKHMNVPGLTATNVSSHLQKYRISVKQKNRKKSLLEIATPEIENSNEDLIYWGKFGSSSRQFLLGSYNDWQREVPQIQKPPPQQLPTIEPGQGYKVQFKSNLLSNASLVTPPNSMQLLNPGMLSAAKSASESLEVRGGLTTLCNHQLGSSPSPTNYVGPRICVNQRGDQWIKFGKPNKSNGDQAVQKINMALLSGGGASNFGIGSVNNASSALLCNSYIGGTGNTGSVKNSTNIPTLLNSLIGGGGDSGNVKNNTSPTLLNNLMGGDGNSSNIGGVKNSTNPALWNSSIGGGGNSGNIGNELLNNSVQKQLGLGRLAPISTVLAPAKNSISPTLSNKSIGGNGNYGNIGNGLLNNSVQKQLGPGGLASIFPVPTTAKNNTSPTLLNNSIGGDGNFGNIGNESLNNSVQKQLGLGGVAPLSSIPAPPTPAPTVVAPASASTLAPTVVAPVAPASASASAVVAPALTSAPPPPAVVAPPVPISVPQQEQDGNKGYEEFDGELFDMRNSPIPDLFGQEEFDDLSFLWSSSS